MPDPQKITVMANIPIKETIETVKIELENKKAFSSLILINLGTPLYKRFIDNPIATSVTNISSQSIGKAPRNPARNNGVKL